MDDLAKNAVREIEQIHSNWINYEVAGDSHKLLGLCADDIEFRPPNSRPLLGIAAVSSLMARGTARIRSTEITDRHIRGSKSIAYLTANFRTTFASKDGSDLKRVTGSHLWILHKIVGAWRVSLVSWSSWPVDES